MKYTFLLAALLASPAYALSISNLDEVSHQVVIEETSGSKVIKRVDPSQTVRHPAGVGKVYLRSKPEQAVRIEELDRLVIWKEGNLQIQMRRHSRGQD